MIFFINIIVTISMFIGTEQVHGATSDENTFVITEILGDDGKETTSSSKFNFRARGICRGDYELVKRETVQNAVKSTIRCIDSAEVISPHATPKKTFAKLRFGIGMLPSCSGEKIGKNHWYCGEKYTVAIAVGPEFNTLVKLNHYSLHKAASAPKLENEETKWRTEEMNATSLMVSQSKEFFGINMGVGLGYFGGLLTQREWIEYPFPRDDDTIHKERGLARGLAIEMYVEKRFAETSLGNFNLGIATSGLFPSSTSNPRVESTYWALPTLEISWEIDLKK